MSNTISDTTLQVCSNGFYCKDIGTTDTSVNVKNFCKLAHDKEYIFSAMALRKEEKFHIRLEVLDNMNNFFVGLTAQDPSNVDFNSLPSNYLLLSECMLFTEMFAVNGRKFEMGIQECIFHYNDQGEFIMENLSVDNSFRIGYVPPFNNLWIFFKCSISFPNLFFVKPSINSRSNGHYRENIPVITRLLPGYFDDPQENDTAVYNNPNNSPETNRLRLKSFLANKGIYFNRSHFDPIVPVHNSNLPPSLDDCCIEQSEISQPQLQQSNVKTSEDIKDCEDSEDSASCVVCLVESKSCLCFPCGHVCFCDKCCKLFSENNKSCPICRRKIEGICKVYY